MASSPAASATAAPFDAAAAGYDASFSERQLGRWLRGIVWQQLERAFAPGQHILELGCGSGDDAIWLAQHGLTVTATDASSAMLEQTRRKVDAAGVGDAVRVARVDLGTWGGTSPQPLSAPERGFGAIETSPSPARRGVGVRSLPAILATPYDGVLANFGPINCVEDRRAVAERLATVVRPGGRVVLGVMGPLCPWEWGWFLLHGQPRNAARRWRSGVTARVPGGGALRVWYPSARRLEREFAPHFRRLELSGVGLLLPPSELGGLVERAPRFFGKLAALDRRCAGWLPWRVFNDNYLLTLVRR